jgi:hypothetical protein
MIPILSSPQPVEVKFAIFGWPLYGYHYEHKVFTSEMALNHSDVWKIIRVSGKSITTFS